MPLRRISLGLVAALAWPALAHAQLKATQYTTTTFSSPIAFIQDTADTANQFVVQQGGRIRLIRNGTVEPTDFANLSSSISTGGERGLLGMALAPDWAASGRFYVYFTAASTGDIVVRRMRRSSTNPLVADTPFKDVVWSTGEAFIRHRENSNHNGGNLAFGPDGYLYIGTGDGGSGNDPPNNAQNPGILLGKMLRIDVNVADNHATGFIIPSGNPFAASTCSTVCPEIWSIGLRNPWRWSFDDPARGGTGALIINDVGQGAREEIDYEPAGTGGRNYGWKIREGTIATPGISGVTPPPTFPTLTPPIHDYDRNSGASTTGGFVYRGSALGNSYRGRYFFGDFVSGRIWSLALTINSSTGAAAASDLRDHTSELGSGSVSAFGIDANGELYFFNYGTSRLYRIELAGPTVSASRSSLPFGAVSNGSSFTSQTPPQAIRLTQSGAGAVSWTATSGASWLQISPASGNGNATITVSVQHVAGLVSTQTANINFTFTGAGSAPSTIPVTLRVSAPGASAAPGGGFDTPSDGATGVTGSIAVTGWAIDDVEVTRVRILRDPVGAEPAGALVFIGNATIVEGARPDILATFPNFPNASKAGFGYLMLTNFLPNRGDGTYRIYAVADDGDGHSTTLGSKVITCSNSTATAPFGAIDTPDQGATVSGVVDNFGWVLSRGTRRADPPGGGTVQVVIDGAFASFVPGQWTSRGDLSALFPAAEYSGINSALGLAGFDSRTLADGVHTIAWLVTDNLGTPAGIGSRYFTVSNGASAGSLRLNAEAAQVRQTRGTEPPRPLVGRRGFDPWAAYESFVPDADGVIVIDIAELDRIELWVGAGASGHSLVGGAAQPLPVGSQLDSDSGRFTWHPGVGFVGAYDLLLGGQRVQIRIGAKR